MHLHVLRMALWVIDVVFAQVFMQGVDRACLQDSGAADRDASQTQDDLRPTCGLAVVEYRALGELLPSCKHLHVPTDMPQRKLAHIRTSS